MIYALILSLAMNILFAAALCKVALSGFSRLSESHERTTKHTEGLVDRVMAGDYTTYQDRQISAIMSQRGPLPDDPDEDFDQPDAVRGPDRGGFGSRLGLVRPVELDLEEELAQRSDL